ncbi:MerC family mercury resistance protein [Fodinicurvata sediminis]|uniref:MerC family mercury resistance protein n=1 Tax=Fodinicurvata sediminis TaxID=1121832 RepID=UPI0003B72C7A|nr:MerC family mercury resistance protein [Fodinicurvata sediminis]
MGAAGPERLKGRRKTSLVGALAALVAFLSCYGTLGLVLVLSLPGISLAVNETLWAAAILSATAVAVLATAAGYPKHRSILPLILVCAGAVLIFYALLGSYHVLLEGLGFVLLIAGVAMDFANARKKR